jgi:hypothetical protein
MPLGDKYTGRLRITGELSATNIVNFGKSAAIDGFRVRTITGHTVLTNADKGSYIICNNATNLLHITLPPVNQCNGALWHFYNATVNGVKIIGDTNAIATSFGVNAADRFKILYMNHTTNQGMSLDIVSDGNYYFTLPRPTMIGNVGLGLVQG